MKNKKTIGLIIGNLVSLLAVIVINALSSWLPLNGLDPGQISDSIPNLFVPSGLTFSIWGLIYIGFLLFGGFNISTLIKKKPEDIEVIERVGIWFIISSVANITWIFLWHWLFVLPSVFAMLTLLASLIVIYLKLGIGKRGVSWKERLMVHLMVSLYFGWITVATIANVTAVLVDQGWSTALVGLGISEVTWTVIVVGAAGILSILNVFTRKDIPYNLVILWALLGIMLKRISVAIPSELGIIYAAGLTMLYVILSLVIKWVKVLSKHQ